MANMQSTFTASGSFQLTDENGVVIFNYSPTSTTASNTTTQAMYSGEHLVQTGASQIALADVNDEKVHLFVKHVDTDYPITVIMNESDQGESGGVEMSAELKPGEFFYAPSILNRDSSGATIQLTADTADQKVQYLICDGIDS